MMESMETIRSHFTGKFCSSKKVSYQKIHFSKNLKTYFLINYNKNFFMIYLNYIYGFS